MRKEAYCSPEVTKLLKEKGFDYQGFDYIDFEGEIIRQDRPTHQMAMQWLRDEHYILITVFPDKIHDTTALFWNVYIVTEKEYKWIFAGGGVNMTYEELIEEALLYVLKTLIN